MSAGAQPLPSFCVVQDLTYGMNDAACIPRGSSKLS